VRQGARGVRIRIAGPFAIAVPPFPRWPHGRSKTQVFRVRALVPGVASLPRPGAVVAHVGTNAHRRGSASRAKVVRFDGGPPSRRDDGLRHDRDRLGGALARRPVAPRRRAPAHVVRARRRPRRPLPHPPLPGPRRDGRGLRGQGPHAADARGAQVDRPELAGDPRTLERAKREVLLARKVTHANVWRLHDLGLYRGPHVASAFLTMDLLRGETLDAHLARRARPRRWPPKGSASPRRSGERRRRRSRTCRWRTWRG
jgi:hypothetical protein